MEILQVWPVYQKYHCQPEFMFDHTKFGCPPGQVSHGWYNFSMRTFLLLLAILGAGRLLGAGKPDPRLSISRSISFAEKWVRLERQRDPLSWCARALGRLTPKEAGGFCGDCLEAVSLALTEQGVSPYDIREASFSDPSWTWAAGMRWVVAERTPVHVFTVLRSGRGKGAEYFAIDPTFVQFEEYALYKRLQETELGREILDELQQKGFWKITASRYEVFLNAAAGGDRTQSLSFEYFKSAFEAAPQFKPRSSSPIRKALKEGF